MTSQLRVGVVGAGLTGLSAAVALLRQFKDIHVSVIADHWGSETVSPVTGSLFLPLLTGHVAAQIENWREWLLEGWRHHFALAKAERAGHRLMTGYYLWEDGECPLYPAACFNLRILSEDELHTLNFHYKQGCTFTTVAVDVPFYLRWLMKEINEAEGEVKYDTIYAMHELYGKYDIVVNCSGRRARELVQDATLCPLKGTVVRVKAAPAENFLITHDDINYVPTPVPGVADVGVAWEEHEHLPGVNKDTARQLLTRAKTLLPFVLKPCTVLGAYAEARAWVGGGGRPRVEAEWLHTGTAVLPTVHNLGLGRHTLTVAWGAAVHVADLVQGLARQILPCPRRAGPFHALT